MSNIVLEEKNENKIGMSTIMPVQARHIISVVAAHKGKSDSAFVWKAAYDYSKQWLKENGDLESAKKSFQEKYLQGWDDEL